MGGYSIGQIAISIILLLVVIGIVLVVMRQTGVSLPQWVWTIIGLVTLGFVAILAVKFLMGV